MAVSPPAQFRTLVRENLDVGSRSSTFLGDESKGEDAPTSDEINETSGELLLLVILEELCQAVCLRCTDDSLVGGTPQHLRPRGRV